MDEQQGQSEVPPVVGATGGETAGVDVGAEGPTMRDEGFTGSGMGSTLPYEPSGDLATGVNGPPNTDGETQD